MKLARITARGQTTIPKSIREEAGLNVPCKVRLKHFTLDDTLILRKAGALSKRDGETVKNGLSRCLAVNHSGTFTAPGSR